MGRVRSSITRGVTVMPAEWEPHERTWMAWPTDGYMSDGIEDAWAAWAAVASARAATAAKSWMRMKGPPERRGRFWPLPGALSSRFR